jgi:hypothetical protein
MRFLMNLLVSIGLFGMTANIATKVVPHSPSHVSQPVVPDRQ